MLLTLLPNVDCLWQGFRLGKRLRKGFNQRGPLLPDPDSVWQRLRLGKGFSQRGPLLPDPDSVWQRLGLGNGHWDSNGRSQSHQSDESRNSTELHIGNEDVEFVKLCVLICPVRCCLLSCKMLAIRRYFSLRGIPP
jgi:hypothetical protein